LQLTVDGHLPALEVDPVGAQTKHLADAQAGETESDGGPEVV
jgi:hypothetical protein